MTIYHGMLLFDIAEPTINGWENELGWRGMLEKWHRADKPEEKIVIDLDEDSGEWEVLHENEETGDVDLLYSNYDFSKADDFAKEWMKTHPEPKTQQEVDR